MQNIIARVVSCGVPRRTVCAVLMLVLSGGPWLALQTIAWTRMLVVYSQQDGFALGVSKTFDGQHPCSLCKSINRATTEERADQNTQAKSVPLESTWLAVLPNHDRFQPAVAPDARASQDHTHAG